MISTLYLDGLSHSKLPQHVLQHHPISMICAFQLFTHAGRPCQASGKCLRHQHAQFRRGLLSGRLGRRPWGLRRRALGPQSTFALH